MNERLAIGHSAYEIRCFIYLSSLCMYLLWRIAPACYTCTIHSPSDDAFVRWATVKLTFAAVIRQWTGMQCSNILLLISFRNVARTSRMQNYQELIKRYRLFAIEWKSVDNNSLYLNVGLNFALERFVGRRNEEYPHWNANEFSEWLI